MRRAVEKNVLIYDCDGVRAAMGEEEARKGIMAEWVDAFTSGPGVIVLKRAETDTGDAGPRPARCSAR